MLITRARKKKLFLSVQSSQSPNRFNVAVTRAKALLVVVGHPIALVSDPNWKEYIRNCLIRSSCFGAGANALSHNFAGMPDDDDTAVQENNVPNGPTKDTEDHQAIVQAMKKLAILGPGTFDEETYNELDPWDEDSPWRVII